MLETAPRVEALRIAPLEAGELPAAIGVLARAFRDNPLNRAVVRRRSARARLRANVHGMRAQLPVARARGHVLGAHQTGGLVGVLLAASPGGYPLPPPAFGARLRSLLGQGPGVASRWGSVYAALDARHPREPHWYLGTLGVDPRAWGRGVGSALMHHWLEQVDRDRRPAWLETDQEHNVGFYRRVGFGVEERLRVLEVPVWLMRRTPR